MVNQEEENEQDNLSPFSLPGKLYFPDAYGKETRELKCQTAVVGIDNICGNKRRKGYDSTV